MFIPFSTFLTSSFFSFSHSRWNHLSTERTDQVLRKGQGKRMSPQNQGLVNTIGTTTSGLCPKSETWMNLVGFVLKGVMLPSWDPKISLISMKWSGTLLSEEEVTLGQYQSSSQTTPTTTSENPSTNGSKRREMVSWKSSPRREPTSSTASTLAVWSMRQTIASKPVIGSTAMRTRWASHWTGSYDTMWGKPQNHKACFVTMLAGYPLRTYSSVSQSGDMNTNVGRMSSSPPKGEQTIEMHGTWKRRATAWRCCSRSCSTVPDMDVVYVNKSWRSGSTRTLIAAAWHALTTTSTRTRLFRRGAIALSSCSSRSNRAQGGILQRRRLVDVLLALASDCAQYHHVNAGLLPHHEEDQPSKHLEGRTDSWRSWGRSSYVHVLQSIRAVGSSLMDYHEERWHTKRGLHLPLHPDRDPDGGVRWSIDGFGTDRYAKDHPVLSDQRRMDSRSKGSKQQDMAPVVRSVGRRPGSPGQALSSQRRLYA